MNKKNENRQLGNAAKKLQRKSSYLRFHYLDRTEQLGNCGQNDELLLMKYAQLVTKIKERILLNALV
jgi:hypothetical protein